VRSRRRGHVQAGVACTAPHANRSLGCVRRKTRSRSWGTTSPMHAGSSQKTGVLRTVGVCCTACGGCRWRGARWAVRPSPKFAPISQPVAQGVSSANRATTSFPLGRSARLSPVNPTPTRNYDAKTKRRLRVRYKSVFDIWGLMPVPYRRLKAPWMSTKSWHGLPLLSAGTPAPQVCFAGDTKITGQKTW
jgi:hypothetical protein